MFGHEAALFTPSGTMANQIAVQTLVKPRQELICDSDAHLIRYESGALAVTGGVSTRTVPSERGLLDVAAIARMLGDHPYAVPVAAIAVEHTHMRGGGTVQPLERLQELRRITAQAGAALHCDAARIWHAHIATGAALATYGALFDTLAVCLSKGLGAPIGSMVIASRQRIAEARRLRLLLGGQMRQAGIIASAGLYALEHHVARLADDHAKARRLAAALAPHSVVHPSEVTTNIINVDVSAVGVDAPTLVQAAAEHQVLAVAVTPHTMRLVTHMDVHDQDINYAAEILTALLQEHSKR